MRPRFGPRGAASSILSIACSLAHAAGGHHAVDDALLVEEGRCEFESWHERPSGSAHLLHLGAGCRIGAVELAAATDRQRQAGATSAGHSLQVKWATELTPSLSAGFAASPRWRAHARPRFQGTTAAALLTWSAVENVRLHANLGRDFVHRDQDETRGGIAVDWSPGAGAWQLAAERFRQEGGVMREFDR
ncbi:hypothetical protein EZ313_08535 [Ramlibacter henchirensis]|uniref:Uncharacterized protein n=1 Tax=Ramlibacter henchirensis TaxID=204072 RepID=A0A4Z0C976_9BURK|nr:hypothetical protein [Ramlibacter henchirensis]TFZ06655.1 hypothetical protein EZ313_08535 [Ramlibacter henchirensis]